MVMDDLLSSIVAKRSEQTTSHQVGLKEREEQYANGLESQNEGSRE
jgi:hypothetical protein